jgi:predicted kinase
MTAQLSKPSLHILCGIPGCGKSTYAPLLDGTLVSSDAIREELQHGDRKNQANNDLVFKVFHNMLRFGLELGASMIADSTALTAQARAKLRLIGHETGATTHLHLFRNNEQAVHRNATRRPEHQVPPHVMTRMLENYEKTLYTLKLERYTSVIEIGNMR